MWLRTWSRLGEPRPVLSQLSAPVLPAVNDSISVSWRFSSACKMCGDSSKDINVALLTNSLILNHESKRKSSTAWSEEL